MVCFARLGDGKRTQYKKYIQGHKWLMSDFKKIKFVLVQLMYFGREVFQRFSRYYELYCRLIIKRTKNHSLVIYALDCAALKIFTVNK